MAKKPTFAPPSRMLVMPTRTACRSSMFNQSNHDTACMRLHTRTVYLHGSHAGRQQTAYARPSVRISNTLRPDLRCRIAFLLPEHRNLRHPFRKLLSLQSECGTPHSGAGGSCSIPPIQPRRDEKGRRVGKAKVVILPCAGIPALVNTFDDPYPTISCRTSRPPLDDLCAARRLNHQVGLLLNSRLVTMSDV